MTKTKAKILLAFRPDTRHMDLVFEMADELGWDLLDLKWLGGSIPADMKFDGALIRDLPDGRTATELRERNCPAVRVGRLPHPQDDILPAVLPDTSADGRLAAEHLVERGYKDVAFVSFEGSNEGSDNHDVLASFSEQAKKLGVNAVPHDINREEDHDIPRLERHEHRERRLAEWIRDVKKPLGIFAVNDMIAIGICDICWAHKLSLPEEVGILGRGDSHECRLLRVPLSSIDTGDGKRVLEAMKLLARMIDGEKPPTSPVMVPPVGVVRRRST